MNVDQKTVKQIARLARLSVSQAEIDNLQAELSGILSWVEQLNTVDTSDVEPMIKVVDLKLPQRQDEVMDGEKADDVTANAPLSEGHFYAVPKVVE